MKKKDDIQVTDYIGVCDGAVVASSMFLEKLRFSIQKWGLYKEGYKTVDIYHLRGKYYEYLSNYYTVPLEEIIDILINLHGVEGAKDILKGLL